MKTQEFINEIAKLGYEIEKGYARLSVKEEGVILLCVHTEEVLAIDTDKGFRTVPMNLFNLAVEYAKTPIEEREEPKKYYLKATGHAEYADFFNYFTDDKSWMIGSKWQEETVQTQFTDQEIKDNPFYEMLKTFEKVEVE